MSGGLGLHAALRAKASMRRARHPVSAKQNKIFLNFSVLSGVPQLDRLP